MFGLLNEINNLNKMEVKELRKKKVQHVWIFIKYLRKNIWFSSLSCLVIGRLKYLIKCSKVSIHTESQYLRILITIAPIFITHKHMLTFWIKNFNLFKPRKNYVLHNCYLLYYSFLLYLTNTFHSFCHMCRV